MDRISWVFHYWWCVNRKRRVRAGVVDCVFFQFYIRLQALSTLLFCQSQRRYQKYSDQLPRATTGFNLQLQGGCFRNCRLSTRPLFTPLFFHHLNEVGPTAHNMSLQKLSTELDGHIASCLVSDTKALSAFSKTNKYYRGIAEPYLYTNIEVYESELERPLRLLFTLLERKELALHIKSLSYVPAQHGPFQDADIGPAVRKKLQSDVWKYTHAIQVVLDETPSPECGFSDFLSAKLTLCCEIMTARMGHYLARDQVFTLILFMAQKVQYLELGSEEPPTHVLRLLWAPWNDGKGPFQNVQRLVHNAGLSLMPSIVVLPALRTLEYNVGYFDVDARKTTSMFAYSYPMPAQPVLHRIQFTTTRNITPAIIQNMVSNPAMANLRELVIDDCGRSTRSLPLALRGDNLPELLRSLEKHTPLLELLQWSS